MRTVRWQLLVLAGAFTGLFALPAGAQQVDIKPPTKLKHDKYVITAEEIAERKDLKDGYDVVRLLRNQWLKPTRTTGSALGSFDTPAPTRGSPECSKTSTDPACTGGGSTDRPVPRESGTPYADSDGASGNSQLLPVIYIDEIKREGVNDLRALRPEEIFEMRFLTGNQASGRYGSGHQNGAILVKTTRMGRP